MAFIEGDPRCLLMRKSLGPAWLPNCVSCPMLRSATHENSKESEGVGSLIVEIMYFSFQDFHPLNLYLP